MSIASDTMTLRLPTKIKKDAMKVADDLGISLSTVIQTYLRRFINEKHITVGQINENHIDYYKSNPQYVEVNSSAEDVASFLRACKKK
jgi:addiction module RelB/DinJ family antitoxin